MKKYIVLATALAIGIALAYGMFFRGDADALQVNQVAADPAAYSGTITVSGVMAGTSSQNPGIFGIFDLKELQCTTPNCNKLYLPVSYQGPLPKLGDEVRVSGSFMKTGDGFIFSASDLTVVRNHRLGG